MGEGRRHVDALRARPRARPHPTLQESLLGSSARMATLPLFNSVRIYTGGCAQHRSNTEKCKRKPTLGTVVVDAPGSSAFARCGFCRLLSRAQSSPFGLDMS